MKEKYLISSDMDATFLRNDQSISDRTVSYISSYMTALSAVPNPPIAPHSADLPLRD